MIVSLERWDDLSSNADQSYLTHGLFRYFGKLPPSITGRILDSIGCTQDSVVLDPMCGSGTTLVEAMIRGSRAFGVDCNPASLIISALKTTPKRSAAAEAAAAAFSQRFSAALDGANTIQREGIETPDLPDSTSAWFSEPMTAKLRTIKKWIDGLDGEALPVAQVAFMAILRKCSLASGRTGRIFRDTDHVDPNPYDLFLRRLRRNATSIQQLADRVMPSAQVEVLRGDARRLPFDDRTFDVVLCHPPYFGLYKYSSDVLRFELEWLGWDRKDIGRSEIADGFKTTNRALVEVYVRDLSESAIESHRVLRPGGVLALVTADSTLGKDLLQVVDPLLAVCRESGLQLWRRIERVVRFSQATYHRSANPSIRRPSDSILMFRK